MRPPELHKRPSLPSLTRLSPRGEAECEVKVENLARSCRRKRRGTAAVEFALVAPIFFMLIIGMLEFGRAVMVQQILTNASREGARIAVLDNPNQDSGPLVKSTVITYLANAGVPGVTADMVVVDPIEPSTGAAYGDPVTVTVSVPFSQVSWVPLPRIPFTNINLKAITLQASTVMRRETVQ